MAYDYNVNFFYKKEDEKSVVDILRQINSVNIDYNSKYIKNMIIKDKEMFFISGKIKQEEINGLVEKLYTNPVAQKKVQLSYQKIS